MMNQDTKCRICKYICFRCDTQVILDRDIAEFFGVETKVLTQAVKRNPERFPQNFCFQLDKEELNNWKSQFVTSNQIKKGLRKRPFAFSEQGVLLEGQVFEAHKFVSDIVRFGFSKMDVEVTKMLARIYSR
mgnify:FL=1